MEDQKETQRELFERLFQNPTIEAMVNLSSQDFEDFVAHVFQLAGYRVENVAHQHFPKGPGVDLNLYAVGRGKDKLIARVEVRRYQSVNLLDFDDVAAFIGKLVLAGNIPGFMVTTSSFRKPAQQAARQAERKIQLIDGQRLLRYITYIGGSRLSGTYAGTHTAAPLPTTPSWLRTGDIVSKRTARPPRTTHILVIANTKGGVAKTTTALNLGFALADLYRQRTLVIDMDGQASLTLSLPRPLPEGLPPAQAKLAPLPPDTILLADYFRGQATLEQTIRPTRFPTLSLIPARREMYLLELGGADRARSELRFMEDLRTLKKGDGQESGEPFDWIVIDTPAGNTFYGRAALAAADYILFPAFAENFAIQGIQESLAMVKATNALTTEIGRFAERIVGCAITRWRSGANSKAALIALQLALQERGIPLLEERIPFDERVETAHRGTTTGGKRSIFRLTSTMGPAARSYDKLAKEVLNYANSRRS